ncbi:MAG TPA: YfhO family protein [Chitinophagaceae bacterium]|nr:YfhO family protein [Chitinophagaceae bacterium]
MKNGFLKKILPHLAALAVFLIIALLYCKPALEGKVLNQSDITNWKGAVNQSLEFAKEHDGKGPLWTNSVFSGMPAFQIGGVPYNNAIPWYAAKIMSLGLPEPVSFFFLASVCFYLLCVVLQINLFAAIMGSLAFAYATYNPVIISVGHITKMMTMAFMPALLASVLLIYDKKKYLLGAALTALFTSILIAMNHPQIAYYLFIALGVLTVFFAINWIKEKKLKEMAFSLGFVLGGAIVGLAINAVTLLSTYEFQKETIRGGGSALTSTDTTTKHLAKGSGLTREYGMSYSMKPAEPLVMFAPRIFGGASDKLEVNEDDSKAIAALRTMPAELQQQLPPPQFYWGGMTFPGEVGTSGPPYIGAIICFLAIIAMFVLNGKHKWWLFTTIVLTIAMSWGHYFGALNNFLFDHLPFYNKFRAPSMILVIPQLLLPLLAALGLNELMNHASKTDFWSKYKKGLIATGALFVLLLFIYMTANFMGYADTETLKQVRNTSEQQLPSGVKQLIKDYFDGLKADRKGLMMGSILRSFGFVLLAAAAVWLLVKRKMKPAIIGIGLALFAFVDVIMIDSKYLNSENYLEKEENNSIFTKTQTDNAILADTSTFRVFNISRNPTGDGITSYHYNSIGGYNAAKILIYQDLLERQMSKPQLNMPVLNMLNVKYLIQTGQNGLTSASQKNDGALGPVWFVNHVQFVKNADEEMKALDNFSPKDTAFVQESYKSSVTLPVPDSTAKITLVKNDNDLIEYSSEAATQQFAVFSEVYYKEGWKAYIDGKEAPIVKTNYVLRGLSVPAGKHSIKFEFKPQGYYKGWKITSIANIALLLLIAGSLFMEWFRNRKK